MNQPLVTIGITTFNAEGTVRRAVMSALGQDWPNSQIVIVDDASSDGTVAILRDIGRERPEIELIVSPTNGGISVSRNIIFDRAQGEFVVFFDDDDISRPDRITRQVNRILAVEEKLGPVPVVCHTAREQVYPNGEFRIEGTMGQGEVLPRGKAVASRVLIGTPLEGAYGSCAGCSQMARLSTYRALSGYDPVFRRCDDTEFLVRLAIADGVFAGLAEPLVRQTMTKSPEKSLAKEREYMHLLIDKHRDFLDAEGAYAFARRWVDVKYFWRMKAYGRFLATLGLLAVRNPMRTIKRLRHANVESNRAFSRLHEADFQRP